MCEKKKQKYNINSGNNQRLQSAGDNDQWSKCFCSNAQCFDQRDQITFRAFHEFLVKVHW